MASTARQAMASTALWSWNPEITQQLLLSKQQRLIANKSLEIRQITPITILLDFLIANYIISVDRMNKITHKPTETNQFDKLLNKLHRTKRVNALECVYLVIKKKNFQFLVEQFERDQAFKEYMAMLLIFKQTPRFYSPAEPFHMSPHSKYSPTVPVGQQPACMDDETELINRLSGKLLQENNGSELMSRQSEEDPVKLNTEHHHNQTTGGLMSMENRQACSNFQPSRDCEHLGGKRYSDTTGQEAKYKKLRVESSILSETETNTTDHWFQQIRQGLSYNLQLQRLREAQIFGDANKLLEEVEACQSCELLRDNPEFLSAFETAKKIRQYRENLRKVCDERNAAGIRDVIGDLDREPFLFSRYLLHEIKLAEKIFDSVNASTARRSSLTVVPLDKRIASEISRCSNPHGNVMKVLTAAFVLLGEKEKSVMTWKSIQNLCKGGHFRPRSGLYRRVINFNSESVSEYAINRARSLLENISDDQILRTNSAVYPVYGWVRNTLERLSP